MSRIPKGLGVFPAILITLLGLAMWRVSVVMQREMLFVFAILAPFLKFGGIVFAVIGSSLTALMVVTRSRASRGGQADRGEGSIRD